MKNQGGILHTDSSVRLIEESLSESSHIRANSERDMKEPRPSKAEFLAQNAGFKSKWNELQFDLIRKLNPLEIRHS